MSTKERLLSAAREQIQLKGYNGFSCAYLSHAVGIQKASIHHHFPTKESLVKEVSIQYRHDFMAALRSIEGKKISSIKKLEAYIQLFRKTLEQDRRVCLCIMLAADHEGLPDSVRAEVKVFFQKNEEWLAQLLKEGQEIGDFELNSEPSELAKFILSSLEGAMVIAESMGDSDRLGTIAQWILSNVEKKPA